MIRTLVSLALLGTLVYCGATVNLGKQTFFGHMSRIFASEETQDLVEDVKQTGEPVLETLGRGMKAGYDEMTRDASGRDPETPAP